MPRFLTAAATACLGVLLLGAAGAQAAGVQLAPHRAVYEMSLTKARSSQAATAVDGRMVFVWKDVCDGWSLEYDTQMELVFADRGSRTVAWRYTAWESDGGDRMRFYLQRYFDGQKTMERRGRARMGETGGEATITEPERRSIDLPAGTLFPGQHSRAMIEAARDGEQFFYAEVFDGTGEQNGLFAANAAILDAASGEPPEIDSPLLEGVPSWRINLAFFAPGQNDGSPQSEQSVRYYANGVAGTLELDYGDFVVEARLDKLEPLGRPDCG
jgi:hypothetical protein